MTVYFYFGQGSVNKFIFTNLLHSAAGFFKSTAPPPNVWINKMISSQTTLFNMTRLNIFYFSRFTNEISISQTPPGCPIFHFICFRVALDSFADLRLDNGVSTRASLSSSGDQLPPGGNEKNPANGAAKSTGLNDRRNSSGLSSDPFADFKPASRSNRPNLVGRNQNSNSAANILDQLFTASPGKKVVAARKHPAKTSVTDQLFSRI